MPPLPYRAPDGPTRYQDLVSFSRRFDRDALLIGLAQVSRTWSGSHRDSRGRIHPFLPWCVSGAAATVITRGTPGGRAPTVEDLRRLCYLYSNLEHPGTPGEPEFGLELLGRFLYQQWPYQRLDLKAWARPIALFQNTPFHSSYQPEVIVSGWESELLGCSLPEFVSIGFTLFAAAKTGGRHPLVWDEGLAELVAAYGGRERFDGLVETLFVTDIDSFKSSRREYVENRGLTPGRAYVREPFTYNPLYSAPFVRGIVPNEALAPSVMAIQIRTAATGILYAGLGRWGTAFSRDVGHVFEQYVGRNLELQEDADVLPEISYITQEGLKLSIDWFVITPEAVVLVECKSAVPTSDIREGFDMVGAHGRLSKAIKQVNNTVQALREQRPEFSRVPLDRPVMALVVTFGDFDLANDPEIRVCLERAEVPTAFVGIEVVEDLATWTAETLRERLVVATSVSNDLNLFEPRDWLAGARRGENRLIVEAFQSLPAVELLSRRRPELFESGLVESDDLGESANPQD